MHHSLKLYSRYRELALKYYIFQARWTRIPLIRQKRQRGLSAQSPRGQWNCRQFRWVGFGAMHLSNCV